MSVKYVQLNENHTEMVTAIYSMKPRQIRRLVDSELAKHHWFTVRESFQPLPDSQLYRNVIQSWELVDGVVEVQYAPEMIYLNGRREVMRNRVHAIREEKLNNGIIFNGVNYDSTSETKQRITGAVLSVVLDQTFQTDWITADNTTVTLNGEDIIRLGKAFAEHESQIIMFARGLKDSIMSSDEPETFDIYEGWPTNEFGTITE